MSVYSRVKSSLDIAWEAAIADAPPSSVPMMGAISQVIESGSWPARQVLFAILAGTAESPGSNPASLQAQGGGVDRRSQAKGVASAMARFRDDRGLRLKLSKEAGVSNPYRELLVDEDWVDRRKGKHRRWAQGIFDVVRWLQLAQTDTTRRRRANAGLAAASALFVQSALRTSFRYPRFGVTPPLAVHLVKRLMDSCSDRPDAYECLVTAAARVLTRQASEGLEVARGDINSPDRIDIVIRSSDGSIATGIEVTDDYLTVEKLQLEVVQAMLDQGLDRAVVFSRGVSADQRTDIDEYLTDAHSRLSKRVDLATIDSIGEWLRIPSTSRDLPTQFIWEIGDELDQYSSEGNRAAWYSVLADYVASAGRS